MSSVGCLSVGIVEELQQLVHLGKSIESVVHSFTSATLPGIMEYGALRCRNPAFPELPAALSSTDLGRALAAVRSDLGLRTDGSQRVAPRNMSIQEFEFFVLEGNDPQESDDWEQYLLRFRQSCKHVDFEMKRALGLGAAFHEMVDNAVNHSEVTNGILAGYHATTNAIVFCVTDTGIGVLASLTKCERYSYLQSHSEAIRLALQNGVSRFGPGDGGTGFNRVFKSLAASYGTLRFRSGQGCVVMDGRDLSSDFGEERFVLDRPGFQVTICCRVADRPDSGPLL